MEEMIIESQKGNISKAFKSMIKSGRPDIRNDENEDLVEKLYVDLLDGEYYLNLATDDNHTIFKGRRGTGKSTIFIQAEKKLPKKREYYRYILIYKPVMKSLDHLILTKNVKLING